MANFLLEIGTEELPADFARQVLSQLEAIVFRDLAKSQLDHGRITCTSTPRRIVLGIDGLASKANDSLFERKGPPVSQAFNEVGPTQAAIGFAKSIGISVSELEVRDTAKGAFVFAQISEKGLSANQFLEKSIPQWIYELTGRRFMRWGQGELRFSRPIRWLVALLDKELINILIEGVDPAISNTAFSRGHRLQSNVIQISSAATYMNQLSSSGVEVDREKRRLLIINEVNNASDELNVFPDINEDLYDELTDLVESPLVLKGKILETYLSLPAEVLSTVMRVHQRYIPLRIKDSEFNPLSLNAKDIISPEFLFVSNGKKESAAQIIRGNERVLKARLADAKFFLDADLAISSDKRVETLSSVTFAEGLGSLKDRVNRMQWITEVVVKQLEFTDQDKYLALEAVRLCKHDLVSNLVSEFPELQGIMGAKYLIAENIDSKVAMAISEHYFPRGAGDKLPKSEAGSVLALAERFELLISIFAKGERPSGSSDPYALRRAGNGILQIIWDRNYRLDLVKVLDQASKYWSEILTDLQIDTIPLALELKEFLYQRIVNLLDETGTDVDIVNSITGDSFSSDSILSDPMDVKIRADLLSLMRETGQLLSVHRVVTRASRLAEKSSLSKEILAASDIVDPSLFEKKSEFDMLNVVRSLEPFALKSSKEAYKNLADGLIEGSNALESFFDGEDSVMVMSDDDDIRVNRLNLLSVLRNQSLVLADFSKIRN